MIDGGLETLLDFNFSGSHIAEVLNELPDALSWLHPKKFWKNNEPFDADIAISALNTENLNAFLVAKSGRQVPSKDEHFPLIERSHLTGHFGKKAVFGNLYHNKKVVWPSIRQDSAELINSCVECKNKTLFKIDFTH